MSDMWRSLRLRSDVLERIRAAAEAEQRSMASWVTIAVEQRLAEQEAA